MRVFSFPRSSVGMCTGPDIVVSDVKANLIHIFVLLIALTTVTGPKTAAAGSLDSDPAGSPWFEKMNAGWGGYVKTTGISSWYDGNTLFGKDEDIPFYDGSASFRLKNRIDLFATAFLDVHYEAILTGGDTFHKQNELKKNFPALSGLTGFQNTPTDDRRLFDLTEIVDDGNGHALYHRLDRLALTLQGQWGTLCLGRQAITWGNGFLSNPMDLFNPFSPTDIEREYKTGDDMASFRVPAGDNGEMQFLVVPRRNPATGKIAADQSSFAGKYHFSHSETEFDLMLARHYGETVAGIGSSGYLKDAAWRIDTTWTSLNQRRNRNGYVSVVANMDYSWVWWNKNLYGFVEFYYNGVGTEKYTDAYADPEIIDRLARGELFFLGRSYLSGQVNIELHPLFNLYLTLINNIYDPSGIIQPWAVWNMTENTVLKLGANFYYGGPGTEFGGYGIDSTSYFNKPPDSIYLSWTWYF